MLGGKEGVLTTAQGGIAGSNSPGRSLAEEQRRILHYLADAGREAVRYDSVQRDLRLEPRLAATALRGLLESGKVTMSQGSAGGSTVTYLSLTASLPEGVSAVLDMVRSAGRNGVDQVTICSTLRIAKAEVAKALQQLMQQKRVKDIRDFANKVKRKYMLVELEPSEVVTGGTFYNDLREIDANFVNRLRHRAVTFVAERVSVSLDQIATFLQQDQQQFVAQQVQGVGKQLSRKDAETIVQTLELDGVLDRVQRSKVEPAQFQVAVGKNVFRNFAATMASTATGIQQQRLKIERRENNGDDFSTGSSANATPFGASSTDMIPAASPFLMPAVVLPQPIGGARGHITSITGWEGVSAQISRMAVTGFPCVGCPQLDSCSATGLGLIKPQSCSYLNSWLSF